MRKFSKRVLTTFLVVSMMCSNAFAFTHTDDINKSFSINSLRDSYTITDTKDGVITLEASEFDSMYEVFVRKGKEYDRLTISPNGKETIEGRLYDKNGNLIHSYDINLVAPKQEPEFYLILDGKKVTASSEFVIPKAGSTLEIHMTAPSGFNPEDYEVEVDGARINGKEISSDISGSKRKDVYEISQTSTGISDFTVTVTGEFPRGKASKTVEVLAYNKGENISKQEEDKAAEKKNYALSISPNTMTLEEGELGEFTINFSEKLSLTDFNKEGYSVVAKCATLEITESEFLSSSNPYKLGQKFKTDNKVGDHTIYVTWSKEDEELTIGEVKVRITEKENADTTTQSGNSSSGSSSSGSNNVTSSTPGAIVSGNQMIGDGETHVSGGAVVGGSSSSKPGQFTPGVSGWQDGNASSETTLSEPRLDYSHASDSLQNEFEGMVSTEGVIDTTVNYKIGGLFLNWLKGYDNGLSIRLYDENTDSAYLFDASDIYAPIDYYFCDFYAERLDLFEEDTAEKIQYDAIQHQLFNKGYNKHAEVWKLGFDTTWVHPTMIMPTLIKDTRVAYVYKYNPSTETFEAAMTDITKGAVPENGYITFDTLASGILVVTEDPIKTDGTPESFQAIIDHTPDPELPTEEELLEGEGTEGEDTEVVTPVTPPKKPVNTEKKDSIGSAMKIAGIIGICVLLLVLLVFIIINRRGKPKKKRKKVEVEKRTEEWNPDDEDLDYEDYEDYDIDEYGEVSSGGTAHDSKSKSKQKSNSTGLHRW